MSLPILHPLARLADLPNRSRTDAPIPPATAVPPGTGPRRWLPAGIAVVHAAWMLAGPAGAQTAAPAPETRNEDPIALSPFVVSTTAETGYQATSTLAGTRLSTSLKDVGAAVSVYTREFLEDINVTRIEDILTYTMSTEAGGQNGNLSGVSGENSAAVRDDPSSINRVRALATATRTRDFFPSDIPSDAFSFESLTISRGPNAVLAGVGSAGGVIDAALRKATFKDSYRLVSRFSDHGSHREEVHLNKVIIPKRLALRLDLLNDDTRFRQQPAYAQDQRVYAAINYRVFEGRRGSFLGHGTFRANHEAGRIEGVPPDPITPTFTVGTWFNALNPKWRYDGARQLVQNAAGATVTGAANLTGIIQGFPLYNQWALIFADPASADPSVGLASPALARVQGFQGTVPATLAGSPGGALRGTGDANRLRTGYYRTHLSDPQIFNFYDQLLTGAFDFRDQRFDASDLRYEQLLLGGKAGVEVAYNRQKFTRRRDFPIPGSGNDEGIMVDVNAVLSVRSPDFPLGIPNPNFGRPFISTPDVFRDQMNRSEREAWQVTAFLKHDFTQGRSSLTRYLGRHTLSALLFNTRMERTNRTYSSTWDPTGQINPQSSLGGALPGTFGTQVNGWFYLGPSLLNLNRVEDVRLQAITSGRPQYGQTYTVQVYNPTTRAFVTGTSRPLRILSAINDQREDLDSTAFALQSNWARNHLVTVVGWREDRDETLSALIPPRLPDGNLDESQIAYQPAVTQGKRSWTKSIVGLMPFTLPGETQVRAFWNTSGNFNPVGLRRNIWNEELGSPSADTREYGLSFSVWHNKLDLRVNRYRTRIKNDAISIGNGQTTYGYISTVIGRMLAARDAGLRPADFNYNHPSFVTFSDVALAVYDTIPDRLKANMGPGKNFDPRFTGSGATLQWVPNSIQNFTSVSDTESTGTEFEAIINPTRNWRLSLSVAKNEAVKANAAAVELAFAAAWKANLDTKYNGALLRGARSPASSETTGTFWEQYVAETLPAVRTAAALSGTAAPEIRKWRANLVTRYDFRTGLLRGVHVGGALRWQDRIGIGYPFVTNATGQQVADITRPHWGPREKAIDLSVGYRRKLQFGGAPIDWSLGLNVRNLNARDRLIPIAANADGTWGTFRIPPERQWSVTNAFAF
jgi:outer membrane receptor protein involved in Fe transport